jgi:capsular polysaccharide transport system permease protein
MDLPDSSLTANMSKMDTYAHVIRALVLRDMRTRFGGSHWGYAVLVLWPVAHIFILVGIMAFRGVPSPLGDSPLMFVATGCVPALTFQYMSREIMKALMMNKPLIYYPQVKLFDIVVARVLVEIVKGFTCLIVVMAILTALGENVIPADPVVAIQAYSAATLLGIGIGIINVGIVSFFPGWILGYIVPTLLLYLTCGVAFVPHLLPNEIYEILKWSPIVQIVEWTRLAYDPNLGVEVDYLYVLMWGMGSVAVGLIMERFVVRRFS